MSEARLPKLFRDALDALGTAEAAPDPGEPLGIWQRRWDAWHLADAILRQEYPYLALWLFPEMGRREAKLDELLRLIADAQKEAGDD